MSRNDEERNLFMNFLAGIGLGAVLGAATALLLAPKAGNETREDLKAAVDDLKNRANKVVAELSESTDELMAKSRDLLDSTRHKLHDAVETGRQTMAQKMNHIEEESTEEQGA
jgi:gas vesicle protein